MNKIADLSKRMRAKRESGSRPYVLVLGAGASVASGTSINQAVVERVVGTFNLKAFDEYLIRCSDDERFAILRDLVEGTSPSIGYDYLADLIRSGYFNEILSTNFDPLLEDAIMRLQMRRCDYIKLIHGVMEPDLIASHMDRLIPRVKILKLHGDLFYRKFYFTGEEIKEFPSQIRHILEIYLNRDILIVGHGMRDTDINCCLKEGGGSIWYVNPSPPSGQIAKFMKLRKSEHNFVSGDRGYFDTFFTQLRAILLGGTAEVSVDEIGQAIFSFAPVGRQPVGSGFQLSNTGLLVTDSSILAGLGKGFTLGVKAEVCPFSAGLKQQAQLVVRPEMELDYAVFKATLPEVSPLELADNLPTVDEPVTACISVGKTSGFYDGKVTGVDCSVPIVMTGGRTITISNLIETDIKITPGACGSPLVRKDGRVVGTIVAGNDHSYALTSLRLKEILRRAGLISGA